MQIQHPRVLGAMLLAVVLITSACSGSDEIDQVTVDQYLMHWSDNIRLSQEVNALEERLALLCMEDLGFTDVRPMESVIPEAEFQQKVFMYWTPEELRETGYAGSWWYEGTVAPSEVATSVEEAFEQMNSGSEGRDREFWEAYWGVEYAAYALDDSTEGVVTDSSGSPTSVPGMEIHDVGSGLRIEWVTEGCLGTAIQALHGENLFDFKRREAFAVAEPTVDPAEDRRYIEAADAWSACMQESGYGIEDPMAVYRPLDEHNNDLLEQMMVEYGRVDEEAFVAEMEAVAQELANADATCIEEAADPRALRRSIFAEDLAVNLQPYEVELFAFREDAKTVLVAGQDLIEDGF